MSFVLLLLYVILQDGRATVKLEQIPFATPEACVDAGQKKIEALQDNPNFVNGLLAKCLQLPTTEAKKWMK